MRQKTPDIMGDILGRPDDRQLVRSELHYDYSLLPDDVRGQVQAAAVEIVVNERRAQDSLITVGEQLIAVKALLDHGQFTDWCAEEFDMSLRTAQNMMNVARTFGGEKRNTISLLSDSAMYLLAAPSTPEPARVQVIEEAQATGQSPTQARVRQIIDAHRPDKPSRTLESAVPVIDIEPQQAAPVAPAAPEGKNLVDWTEDDWAAYSASKERKATPAAGAPSRNGQVDQMVTMYRMVLESTGNYEQLTGIYSHSGALRRALQPMIDQLERNRK